MLPGRLGDPGRQIMDDPHAGDCVFRDAMPEVYLATIRDIAGFVHSL